jgi:hypothetical protein
MSGKRGENATYSEHTVVLADTNLFIAVGAPDSDKYVALRRWVRQSDVTLRVPRRVRGELRTMHAVERVDTAVADDWAMVIDPPEPTAGDAVAAMDLVRRYIADRTGQDEHEVEKADTVFAGVAIQYLQEYADKVVILTDDKYASAGIERAVETRGYDDAVEVLRRTDILGDDDLEVI